MESSVLQVAGSVDGARWRGLAPGLGRHVPEVLRVGVPVASIDVGRDGLLGILVQVGLLPQCVVPGAGDIRPQVTDSISGEVEIFLVGQRGQLDVEALGTLVQELGPLAAGLLELVWCSVEAMMGPALVCDVHAGQLLRRWGKDGGVSFAKVSRPTCGGGAAVLVGQEVARGVHVHAAEGGQARVERALLDGGQLHALEVRVVIRVARHLQRRHALHLLRVHAHRRHP